MTHTRSAATVTWCNGPLVPSTVRLDGQQYKGTCKCGRHNTRTLNREGTFAQAHIQRSYR